VVCRHDLTARELEGLDRTSEALLGDWPESLTVIENNHSFTVPGDVQQKTGWFYDHRATRQAVAARAAGAKVLDLYSYLGGFGLQAALAQASEVVSVDSSAPAMQGLMANAEQLSVANRMRPIVNDAVTAMRELIKRKKDREAGTRHYQLNHKLALRLLAPGGWLFSASCSQAFSEHDGIQAARANLPRASSALQILGTLRQDKDHPVHASMPETLYLTGFCARLI